MLYDKLFNNAGKIKPSDIFECKKCGDCCKGYGGTFVTDKDIEAIAGYIGADPKTFIAGYCTMSGEKPLLDSKEDGYCIFWDGLCAIHPVKPKMCRAWPFIENLLADANNWRIMASLCPGIRADAPDSIVIECVKERLAKKSDT